MPNLTVLSRVLCGFVTLGVVGAGAASADPSQEVDLQIIPPAAHGVVPRIQATIEGSELPASALSIRAEDGVAIRASEVHPYADSGDPAAIAIVINGQEIWVGNDEIETDENARIVGILGPLEHAIDNLHVARLVPPGSQAAVISYSTGAQLTLPMSPISKLAGAALGSQKDYYRRIGTDLVQGVTMGIAELEHTRAARKLLIIIGDGNDTNNEVAKSELVELRKEAAKAHITTASIIYKSEVSAEENVITAMVPGSRTVHSGDGIESELAHTLDVFAARYTVIFPGAVDGASLPWDSRLHDLTVRAGSDDLDPAAMILPRWQSARSWSWMSWYMQLAAGGLLAGLWLLALAVRSRLASTAPSRT